MIEVQNIPQASITDCAIREVFHTPSNELRQWRQLLNSKANLKTYKQRYLQKKKKIKQTAGFGQIKKILISINSC